MTDKMIAAGAKRLSEMAPALKDPDEALLPPFGGQSYVLRRSSANDIDAAKVNFEVALAVVKAAVEEGVAQADVPADDGKRRTWAAERRWDAAYSELRYSKDGIA